MSTPFPDLPRRQFYPQTKVRAYRLGKGVLLSESARQAQPPLTLVRASEIERFPEKARPGELERLLAGVDRAAAEGILND
jgi:hypothetical protein